MSSLPVYKVPISYPKKYRHYMEESDKPHMDYIAEATLLKWQPNGKPSITSYYTNIFSECVIW